MNDKDDLLREQNKYLIFTLGGEQYGTPLMDVREVVEYQKAKLIPHTHDSFQGVINIRGEIIGVVDLRLHFGYENTKGREMAMMVFSIEGGALAAVTDRMDGVIHIAPDMVDRAPRIDSRLSLNYLLGVGRVKDKLVTLVDLKAILHKEEVTRFHQAASGV